MTLLLYALTDRALQLRGTHGVGAARLRLISDASLSAVVSDFSGAAPAASEERLWEYEHALERLMSRGPILPARFGSEVASEARLLELLGERRGEMEGALERVRGAVEVALSSRWRDPPPASGSESGTAYMQLRLELHRRAASAMACLSILAERARSCRTRVLPSCGVPVQGSYLVEETRLEEFADLVAELDRELEEVELVCTGPWPPFSFTVSFSAPETAR